MHSAIEKISFIEKCIGSIEHFVIFSSEMGSSGNVFASYSSHRTWKPHTLTYFRYKKNVNY